MFSVKLMQVRNNSSEVSKIIFHKVGMQLRVSEDYISKSLQFIYLEESSGHRALFGTRVEKMQR